MDESDKDIYMSKLKMYIDKYGTKIYKNSKGEYHRLDGPAWEHKTRDKEWYKEDLCHREKGPAIEYANGDKVWCVKGKKLKEKEFNLWIQRIKKFIRIK